MATTMLNMGEPRNVRGHVVSGALAAGMVASAMNYDRYQKATLSKEDAIKNTLKLSIQGGIATGSAIAAANYLGRGSLFGMLSAISIGIAGIYGVEKLYEKAVCAPKTVEIETKTSKEEEA